MLEWIGTIKTIIEVDVGSVFKAMLFDVEWFDLVCTSAHATICKDHSGLYSLDSTRRYRGQDTLARVEQCEQVCLLRFNKFYICHY